MRKPTTIRCPKCEAHYLTYWKPGKYKEWGYCAVWNCKSCGTAFLAKDLQNVQIVFLNKN